MKIEIPEGSTFQLEAKYLEDANLFIEENPALNLSLIGNQLKLPPYIVGQIKIQDLSIIIKPRNTAINMKSIFEMNAFVNLNDYEEDLGLSNYDLDNDFGFSDITRYFCDICKRLLQSGLTGEFISKRNESFFIVRGSIDFESYNKYLIPQYGIQTNHTEYTINVKANQLIKSALLKLVMFERNNRLTNILNTILRDFESVNELSIDNQVTKHTVHSFYSSNRFYPIVLETALKILGDLKIAYGEGQIKWYSFLVNSNTLFEKYIFKILKLALKQSITKWTTPKDFASIKYNSKIGYKSFSPDVLVDYIEDGEYCKAVIDVKNKDFSPKINQLGELVSSPDLYQLIFYCNKLKTNIGGLIFPGDSDIEPIQVLADAEKDPEIFLLSINMQKPFKQRHKELIQKVEKTILQYS